MALTSNIPTFFFIARQMFTGLLTVTQYFKNKSLSLALQRIPGTYSTLFDRYP